eukprot:SAG11_NODE_16115_length_556_cov_1.617068_2_plen_140_part_01
MDNEDVVEPTSFTLHNKKKLKKLNGFKLFDEFVPTLQKYLQEHNGIKFYFNARYIVLRLDHRLHDAEDLNARSLKGFRHHWPVSAEHTLFWPKPSRRKSYRNPVHRFEADELREVLKHIEDVHGATFKKHAGIDIDTINF